MKVILKKCTEYDVSIIKEGISTSLKELGGLEKYVKPLEKVILKVNLLTSKKPELAATTHPAFVEALIEIFKENNNEVIIADSPGGVFIDTYLKRVYKSTGMDQIAKNQDIKLNKNYNSFDIFSNDSKLYKKMKICSYIKDADHIISVSKMKTHSLMTFTGAVKNMFGVVPGLSKANLHLQYPNMLDFGDMLLDVCNFSNPTLSFMDGIVAMEGEGPGSGDPVNMNVMLTSQSPHHLDVVATKIINLDPLKVPTIVKSIERKIVKEDFSDIEVVGNIDDFKKNNFVKAKTNDIDSVSKYSLGKYFKRYPKIITKSCIGCRICADICPVKTIDIVDGKAVINFENCISCFCCHEFCPEKAITVKRRLLRKI